MLATDLATPSAVPAAISVTSKCTAILAATIAVRGGAFAGLRASNATPVVLTCCSGTGVSPLATPVGGTDVLLISFPVTLDWDAPADVEVPPKMLLVASLPVGKGVTLCVTFVAAGGLGWFSLFVVTEFFLSLPSEVLPPLLLFRPRAAT